MENISRVFKESNIEKIQNFSDLKCHKIARNLSIRKSELNNKMISKRLLSYESPYEIKNLDKADVPVGVLEEFDINKKTIQVIFNNFVSFSKICKNQFGIKYMLSQLKLVLCDLKKDIANYLTLDLVLALVNILENKTEISVIYETQWCLIYILNFTNLDLHTHILTPKIKLNFSITLEKYLYGGVDDISYNIILIIIKLIDKNAQSVYQISFQAGILHRIFFILKETDDTIRIDMAYQCLMVISNFFKKENEILIIKSFMYQCLSILLPYFQIKSLQNINMKLDNNNRNLTATFELYNNSLIQKQSLLGIMNIIEIMTNNVSLNHEEIKLLLKILNPILDGIIDNTNNALEETIELITCLINYEEIFILIIKKQVFKYFFYIQIRINLKIKLLNLIKSMISLYEFSDLIISFIKDCQIFHYLINSLNEGMESLEIIYICVEILNSIFTLIVNKNLSGIFNAEICHQIDELTNRIYLLPNCSGNIKRNLTTLKILLIKTSNDQINID